MKFSKFHLHSTKAKLKNFELPSNKAKLGRFSLALLPCTSLIYINFKDIFRTPYIFAVSTQARALLLAAGSEAEASGWLYAFNPLLAQNKYFEVNFNPSHQEEVEE